MTVNHSRNLERCEPLVIQVLKMNTSGPMSVVQMARRDPILATVPLDSLARLVGHMTTKRLIEQAGFDRAEQRRLYRIAWPDDGKAVANLVDSWQKRPEWKPCRLMAFAIERCNNRRGVKA